MGWWGRLAFVSGLAVAGCTALAGERGTSDGQETNPAEIHATSSSSGSTGSSSGGSSSGSSSGSSGTSSSGSSGAIDASTDTGIDAAKTGCQPPKQPNGYTPCTANAQCCSDHCNEAATCASDCRGSFSTCNPADDAPCCFGSFCSTQLGAPTCQACIQTGGTPRNQIVGGGAKSCCSRKIDGTGKCQ